MPGTFFASHLTDLLYVRLHSFELDICETEGPVSSHESWRHVEIATLTRIHKPKPSVVAFSPHVQSRLPFEPTVFNHPTTIPPLISSHLSNLMIPSIPAHLRLRQRPSSVGGQESQDEDITAAQNSPIRHMPPPCKGLGVRTAHCVSYGLGHNVPSNRREGATTAIIAQHSSPHWHFSPPLSKSRLSFLAPRHSLAP